MIDVPPSPADEEEGAPAEPLPEPLEARTGAGCSAPLQYGMTLELAPAPDDAF